MASDRLIINAVTHGHYQKGQKRLVRSLDGNHDGDISVYTGWASPGYDESNPYTIKAAAMEQHVGGPHRFIVWMDASCVAIRPLDPLFERIEERGFYLASSGYNAAQTCTDRQLDFAGIGRNWAEAIPDTATGIIGIDLHNKAASTFLFEWIQWAKMGLFDGKRTHSKRDSADPRFMFGRQDQSAATLLAHIWGLHRLDELGVLSAYDAKNLPDTVCVKYQGIK